MEDYFNQSATSATPLNGISFQTEMDHLYRATSAVSFRERARHTPSEATNATAGTRFKDNDQYIYHTVHLNAKCPPQFLPMTPKEVFEGVTGTCQQCTNDRAHNLDLGRVDSGCEHVSLPDRIVTPKSILASSSSAKAGTAGPSGGAASATGSETPVDFMHESGSNSFGKSVSFDTVNTSIKLVYKDPQEQGNYIKISGVDNKAEESLEYPTKPIVTHDSVSLTKKHKLYDDLYANRLSKDGGGKVAKLPNREVMCYISGRKHTWTAIDWCCNRLLEHGDSLVIVASIRSNGRSLARFATNKSDDSLAGANGGIDTLVGGVTENKIRNSPEWSQACAENIMKYCLAVINPTKIVKISVELCVGTTDEVLSDMFALYQPNIVVTGTKPSKNTPTRPWATKRLTDRLVSSLPVPMIIVPSKNMGNFEKKLFKALDDRMEFINANNKNTILQRDEILKRMDEVGIYSLKDQHEAIIESGSRDDVIKGELKEAILEKQDQKKQMGESGGATNVSDSEDDQDNDEDEDDASEDDISVDSTAPPVFQPKVTDVNGELKRMELEYQLKVYKQFEAFEQEPLNPDSFKDRLCIVMDAASKYGRELADAANNSADKKKSKLFRDYIGVPELQRTKSMVSEAGGMSAAELQEKMIADYNRKKALEAEAKNSAGTDVSQSTGSQRKNAPKILISNAERSPSLSPKSSRGERPSLTASLSQPVVNSAPIIGGKKKRSSLWNFFKS